MSRVIIDGRFVHEVSDELVRADAAFPGQVESVSLEGWLSILTEEVGEVARALNERLLGDSSNENRANLLVELVQVAAMACRMTSAVEAQWPA